MLNYDADSVNRASSELIDAELKPQVMIDCSHANSQKEYQRQADVCNDVCRQIIAGDQRIIGIMLESHLVEGRQDVTDIKKLTYGQSITDACINWETTEELLHKLAQAVAKRRSNR